MQAFALIPYSAAFLPGIVITGEIQRKENQLSLRYSASGEIASLLIPPPSGTSSRRHNLWKATCFEFFLAIPQQPHYWEFNLSPCGDWNVYAMDAYRQVNMREEPVLTQLPFRFQRTNENISLELSLNLGPMIHAIPPLQVGITAIIQTLDGNETYWALAHPGPQADFHLRESFILSL